MFMAVNSVCEGSRGTVDLVVFSGMGWRRVYWWVMGTSRH